MAHVTYFCNTCVGILNTVPQKSKGGERLTQRRTEQTLEAFREAARQKCFICSRVWTMTAKNRAAWSSSQDWCTPHSFMSYEMADGVIQYLISFQDPVRWIPTIATFLNISVIDEKYGNLFSFEKIPQNTSSPETLDLAYQWYENCMNFHEQCKRVRSTGSPRIPTRLTDIGNDNDTNWQLKITNEDFKCGLQPPYMTLSYKWGLEPSILLLSSNIEEFRQGMSHERLPQTFKDFVVVVRRFNIRYIWIGSLCIIQDSEEDWQSEAPKMQYVYGGSAFNVAASASSAPEDGMFRRRSAEEVHPGIVETATASSGLRQSYIFDRLYWDNQLNSGPLHDRGWVFQECLLAPRVLYFSSSEIFFECFSEHKCEGFPRGIPFHESHKGLTSLQLVASSNEPSTPLTPFGVQRLWMETITRYSCCEFTKVEDKLWGISGIAHLFQSEICGRYLAGLWESWFVELMHWSAEQPQPRLSSTYCAPSWSWAAIDGPVGFHATRSAADYTYLVEIVEVDTTPINGQSFGGISDAFLRLKGFLAAVKCRLRASFFQLEIDSKQIDVPYRPDIMDTSWRGYGEIFILLFANLQYPDGSDVHLECLALEMVDSEKQIFRRSGVVWLMANDDDEEKEAIEKLRSSIATMREITMV